MKVSAALPPDFTWAVSTSRPSHGNRVSLDRPGTPANERNGRPGLDDAAVINATGRSLGDWFATLDEAGARTRSHKEIARLLHDELGVPSWWSQMVTVEYERAIGRRQTGQSASGEYRTTVSRSLPGSVDEALDRWLSLLAAGDEEAFDGVPFAAEPTVSRTAKRTYWRVPLADGSRVTAYFSAKPGGEAALLAVETGRLGGTADIARWKAVWKALLADL
jgi:hypothetical protein